MDYSIEDFLIEESLTPYHPTEKGWYIKHKSGLYLGTTKEGVKKLMDTPFWFMTEQLANSYLKYFLQPELINHG